MANKTRFKQLKKQRQIQYKRWKKCYCPILKDDVHFTSDGFYHLRYEVSGRQRTIGEQMYKLGLLPLVIPVIKNAKKIDLYKQIRVPIGRKKKGGKRVEKDVGYWSLVELVGKQQTKVKVVVRQVGAGKIIFWSVMKYERKQKPRR
jgi:hypothetical protein